MFSFDCQIFTDRPDDLSSDDRLKPDFIVDYLSRFPQAIIIYLEVLVYTKNIEVTEYRLCVCVENI